MYILDFSFSAEVMVALDERAAKLVMLDHHKSAAEKLSGFAYRSGVVHFDMNKSGAYLAWEFFQPLTPVLPLLQYVEGRDIWKWEFTQSAGFLSALDRKSQSFERWRDIASFTPAQLAELTVGIPKGLHDLRIGMAATAGEFDEHVWGAAGAARTEATRKHTYLHYVVAPEKLLPLSWMLAVCENSE